jgi:simple sugar transport system ATP-binding protein
VLQDAGVGVIPPDRRLDGLVAEMPVRDNLVLSRKLLARFSRRGVLQKERIDAFARQQARLYQVRESALDAEAGTLSGGNQQRIVVARALAGSPEVLVAVNPTRGLDIAAARAVYDALNRFVEAGKSVVLISTDLDEAMEMSDRIAVLFRHRLSPLLEPPYSLEHIGLLMAGAEGEA